MSGGDVGDTASSSSASFSSGASALLAREGSDTQSTATRKSPTAADLECPRTAPPRVKLYAIEVAQDRRRVGREYKVYEEERKVRPLVYFFCISAGKVRQHQDDDGPDRRNLHRPDVIYPRKHAGRARHAREVQRREAKESSDLLVGHGPPVCKSTSERRNVILSTSDAPMKAQKLYLRTERNGIVGNNG